MPVAAALLLALGSVGLWTYLKVPDSTISGAPQSTTTGAVVPSPEQDVEPGASQPASEEEVIQALEWLANTRLKQDRLTDPPADNAHYYFRRLFALDEKMA